MEKAKHIRFQLGEETQHIIEAIDDQIIESSLFSDQYKKALASLEAMFSSKLAASQADSDNTPNNIFAFIGDRGSGKTSCMMSLAKLLEKGLKKELKAAYPAVASRTYRRLERIDPSFFDESHNAVELFLASLYNNFCNAAQNSLTTSDTAKSAKEREVLELFSQAQKMMSEMTKTVNDQFDALDNLQNLSAGVQLWSIIRDLTSAYVSYLGDMNGVLILPIDDIDLNSRMAAAMMEQIRKFLIQPNIIILFAVKIDQLESSKRLSLTGEYAQMLQLGLLQNHNVVINKMTEAYLTKLLPHHQRIYMPDGSVYFNQPITIVRTDKTEEEYSSVRQMIPELIFQKTRYLFYNTSDKTSYIVPDNLRELRFLVGLLYSMEDYWKKKEDKEEHRESNRYNKLLFRKYLYENWVSNNLSTDMQISVKEILNTHDSAQINAMVLACINKHFDLENYSPKEFSRNSLPPELRRILKTSNINYNIAIGDVLDLIDFLEGRETETQKLKFIFIIRSLYSMYLYQYYDAMTDEESSSNDQVFSKTRISYLNLSEYEKFVAGYFINSRLSRLVPSGRLAHETRSERVINFGELLRLINEVIKEDGNNSEKLRLVEFFMLAISRRYDMQDHTTGMNYRTYDYVFYAESLENLYKNAYFDIGALLFNLTRIEDCYKRFSKGNIIYELATKKDSLLNRLHKRAKKRAEGSDASYELGELNNSYWKSYYCFRNAEIIKAFKEYIEDFKSPGGSHNNVLAKAFKRMSEFSIPFYDKLQNGKYSEIEFSYLKEFEELLDTYNIQDHFMNVFDYRRPTPENIDIQVIISRAQLEQRNRKDSRLDKLNEKYPIIAQNYQNEINTIFDEYGEYMTREELNTAFTRLNKELESYRMK